MAKHYSEGAFLRRIRRTLMPDGLAREISIVPKPAYKAITSPNLIEIRTMDGEPIIQHHSTGLPGTPSDVERICAQQRRDTGVPIADVEAALARIGHALRTGDGMRPLVMSVSSDLPLMLVAPVTLHDMSGRPRDGTVNIPFGNVPGHWRKHAELHELELDIDRRRRDRKGRPRELVVCGALAALLRELPEGRDVIARMRADIETTIDAGGRVDDHTPITIDGLRLIVDGIPLVVGPRGVRTHKHLVGGAALSGNTLTVRQRLPETVAIGLAGRRLDEIVEPAPLKGPIRILRATSLMMATAITLDLKPVALRAPEDELVQTAP